MVHIRRATPADAMAVAEVHIRAWQAGYRGLVPQDFLDRLQAPEQAGRYAFATGRLTDIHTLVAVEESAICGHVTVGPARDPALPDIGEIWSLYVDPPRWGTGIAQALASAGTDLLFETGHRFAALWVLTSNSRARRFYESQGWRADGGERTELLAGNPFHEARYVKALQR
jgi:GNAT superfamily N-acetyltransferase